MRLQRKKNGDFVFLNESQVLGTGGEGKVYAIPQDESLVAKIYHSAVDVPASKLLAMLDYSPVDPTREEHHASIAWPVDLLIDPAHPGTVLGYVMPRVEKMHPIFAFYNPASRLTTSPLFTYTYLYRTARNLMAAVTALHDAGCVIGDVNESNILVSETALVTLVDTDSFQIRNLQTEEIYRCPVGKPQFTSPELQGVRFSEIDRSPEHDLFGLAVILFQLLMEGTHPFDGVYQGAGDPPLQEERIAAGHFPYSGEPRIPYTPKPIAPPFEILPPAIQSLFRKCFEAGHQDPQKRPSARLWRDALYDAEKNLIGCPVRPLHTYSPHLSACPWCERAEKLGGRDPFPTLEQAQERTASRKARAGSTTGQAGSTGPYAYQAGAGAVAPQSVQPQEGVGCNAGCVVLVFLVIWVAIIITGVGVLLSVSR